jgi:hypothetical protein
MVDTSLTITLMLDDSVPLDGQLPPASNPAAELVPDPELSPMA